jgi:dihydrofolate synthase / folylpolyglutamate synthase
MAMDGTDFGAVSEYLFRLKPRGSKLGIDRMRPFAALLGHPERALPVIHVAGTNGKGSVAVMIESVLRAAGWRVGLYTSPHLVHLGERVQVNRVPLTSEQIVAFTRELDPVADRVAHEIGVLDRPTFFEFMTAMALLHFQRQRCDIAVVEVGLGGEFDATNILNPLVSVITSIGLDHCEWLGTTLDQIARAKAGIIKPARPVVIGRLPPVAEKVMRHHAEVCRSSVFSVRQVFGENVADYPATNLAGDYQRWNAATAVLALRTLSEIWKVSTESIQRGLNQVDWPGRWQRIRLGKRLLILDASHNPEGATVLEQNMKSLYAKTGLRPIVITGVLGADRAKPLIDVICRFAQEINFVVPKDPRATPIAELRLLVPNGFDGRIVASTVQQLFPGGKNCTAGGPNDVVVVTGSIYLLGEVLQQLGDLT